jgi:hypothetical protein
VHAQEPDPATRALRELADELDRCTAELQRTRQRAEELLSQRATGTPWLAIVESETRPLVVEGISSVLASLATAGHAFRQAQAVALLDEGVSINRIAGMFGVTRQRISTLLRGREDRSPGA